MIYTEVIIILQFVWQLPFISDYAASTGKTWGFYVASDLWSVLRFHLVILIFTVIQQNTYEIINRKDKQSRYMAVGVDDTTVVTAPLEFGLQSFRFFQVSKKIFHVCRYLSRRLTMAACYLIFSLIGLLGPVTMFKLGYIAFVFANFLLQQLQMKIFIRKFWVVICLYPALVASMCYVYQFNDLQNSLKGYLGDSLLSDIGLQARSGSNLFEYLLQHIVALFFCVWQYRIFRSKESLRTGKFFVASKSCFGF